jgi:hypothetical protein
MHEAGARNADLHTEDTPRMLLMNVLANARLCVFSHHESIPEGDAAVPHDDSNSAGNVGTPAGNT